MTLVVVEYVTRVGLLAAAVVTLCVLVGVARRSRAASGVLALGVVLGVLVALLPVGSPSSAAVPWPIPSPRPTTHSPVPRPSYTPTRTVPPVRPSATRSGIHVPGGVR